MGLYATPVGVKVSVPSNVCVNWCLGPEGPTSNVIVPLLCVRPLLLADTNVWASTLVDGIVSSTCILRVLTVVLAIPTHWP